MAAPARIAGHALLVVGTIVGSVGGARLPHVDWRIAGVGFALLLIAVVLLRSTDKRKLGEGPKGASPYRTSDRQPAQSPIARDLAALIAALEPIVDDAPTAELSELGKRLSAVEREHVVPLSEATPAMLSVLGAARFADVFGGYASGERMFARAWSAVADGHRPEALRSLGLALERFRVALGALGEAADAPDTR